MAIGISFCFLVTVTPNGMAAEVRSTSLPLRLGDWKQEHFDSRHSGSNSAEHILSPANVSGLVAHWTVREPVRVQGTLAVSNGVVFAQGQDAQVPSLAHIYAFDAATGDLLWAQSQPGGSAVNGIGVCCGMIFVGLLDHTLRAYDAATGTPRWVFQAQGGVGHPTVVGRRLFVQSNEGAVHVLDAITGEEVWHISISGAYGTTAPAVASGTAYVAAGTRIHALRARDGKERWVRTLPNLAFGSPTVVDGIIYEALLEDGLYALAASTGQTLWHQPTGEGVQSTPTVDDHSVYIGDVDGNIRAFHPKTGAPQWTTFVGGRFVFSDPVEANGVVYAATTGIFALDSVTGEILWSAPTDEVNVDPPIVDGTVYVGDFAGDITAYELSS